LKRLLAFVLAILALPLGLLALVLDSAPAVPALAAPEAAAPEKALALRRAYIAVLRGQADAITLRSEDFDALFGMAARLHPDVRGRVRPTAEGLEIEVSLGAPLPVAWRWLNLRAVAAPSEDGLSLTALGAGALPLPARHAPRVAATALDALFGGEAFTGTLESIARVEVSPASVTVGFGEGPPSLDALGGRTVAGLRRLAFHSDGAALDRHFAAQAAAGPAEGSAAGWLAAALVAAAEAAAEAGGSPRAEIEAALFALGLHCGDARLSAALGSPKGLARGSRCDALTLGGRVDLRRHFSISAALHAASAAQPAFGVGEIKELHDSRGGTGFSFDDIAANRAGIRFAERMIAGGPADWRRAAALLADERSVFPAVDDLPAGLTDAAFAARFGSVDSPRYAEMLDAIERRVAALPVLR
jgi:hypothetical protein